MLRALAGMWWQARYGPDVANICATWLWASTTEGQERLGGGITAFGSAVMSLEGRMRESRDWLRCLAQNFGHDWPADVVAILEMGWNFSFQPIPGHAGKHRARLGRLDRLSGRE